MAEALNLFTEIVQDSVLIALALWSLRCSAKSPKPWLFQLLAGAFGCFLLGNLYLALHVRIMDDWAFVFSPADVSWLGMYSFFIAIDSGLASEWTPGEQRRAKAFRRHGWLGAAVVVAFHAAYIALYPEIWLNNLVFCVALSVLGYHAFSMYFASRGKDAIQPAMHRYHTAILFFLMTELVLFLVSSIDNYPLLLYYIVLWVLTAGMCFLVPTARKGVGA